MNSCATGFFIHRTGFSTRGQRCTFFTKEYGKISLILFKNKKDIALIPLGVYEIILTSSPKFGQGTVKSIALLNGRQFQAYDPAVVAIAYFVCDVVVQTATLYVKDDQAYQTLSALTEDLTQRKSLHSLPCSFLLKWMKSLGILPEGNPCATGFDIHEGLMTLQLNQNVQPGVNGLNKLLLDELVNDRKELRATFDLMLLYMEYHIPKFNVTKTRTIIHEIFN